MTGQYPKFRFQHTNYKNKWEYYYPEYNIVLNKALSKKQKTVTLSCKKYKVAWRISFEKMVQKNMNCGVERRVRCLGYNDSYFCWNWLDDNENWISFPPHICLYLEICFEKKLMCVDILLKDEYEIDLNLFKERNKRTNKICSISRDSFQDEDDEEQLKLKFEFEDFVKRMSKVNENGIKNILLNLPVASRVSTNVQMPSTSQDRIVALNAEASRSDISTKLVDIDRDFPDAKKCYLFSEKNVVYNATLNYTNVQENSNKYFIIQLLRYKGKKTFAVWFHWGRVGSKGRNELTKFQKDVKEAKLLFERKFYEKTGNHWQQTFNKVEGKYDLVHINISEVPKPVATAESKLDRRVHALLKFICNKKNLEEAAEEMSYDSHATPLGTITAKQILEGYNALNRISDVLQKKGVGKELVEACNTFYTKIPHNFGRKPPPVLSTMNAVKDKLKMLEALSNICLAMDFMEKSEGPENPIDKFYQHLECDLIPLEHTSEQFDALSQCLMDTQGPTHRFSLEIVEAYKCTKQSEEEKFLDYGNKKLLWHGSRICNWLSILKNGLQIAPSEAISTGSMFGEGIYFADVSTKSANYCYSSKRKSDGILLLCEVSLGLQEKAYYAFDFTNSLPSMYNSVQGIGQFQPFSFKKTVLSSEAKAPCGPLINDDIEDHLSLNYNEYIIFNKNQVKMRYLVHVKMHFHGQKWS